MRQLTLTEDTAWRNVTVWWWAAADIFVRFIGCFLFVCFQLATESCAAGHTTLASCLQCSHHRPVCRPAAAAAAVGLERQLTFQILVRHPCLAGVPHYDRNDQRRYSLSCRNSKVGDNKQEHGRCVDGSQMLEDRFLEHGVIYERCVCRSLIVGFILVA